MAQLLVAHLLEDTVDARDVADQYLAWTLQRGGTGYDMSTFRAWLRHFYPEHVNNAEEIFTLVSAAAGKQSAA